MQKERQDQLAALSQEIAQKRSNRLKDVHEYKKVKESVAKERENAQTYKKISNSNAILANQNYNIYQKNAEAVKKAQAKLDNLNKHVSEAQKKLSSVSKEKQRQLDALNQEIAQKRSEKLRELSKEIEEKRKTAVSLGS